MNGLAWFDTYPPNKLTLPQVTGMVRALSGRPRRPGLTRLTPIVVFELHLSRERVRWLVGTDSWMARSLPAELRAQAPGLTLTRSDEPERPLMSTAREVRFEGLAYPLRTDTGAAVASGLYHLAAQLGPREQAVVQWIVGPSNDRRRQPAEVVDPLVALGFKQPVTPDGEAALWKTKIAEPLFGVRGRVGVRVADLSRADVLLRSLVAGLWLAAGAHGPLKASHQSARTARLLDSVMGRSRTWSSLVNASELAVLIGWPVDGVAVPQAPLMLAPPPTALLAPETTTDDEEPTPGRDERTIGRAVHPSARERRVLLPVKAALSHSHIIGPTGSGKSTLLTHLITADAVAGRSVLVIDPKGDLVTDVLERLPAELHGAVVVIEPGDGKRVVGVNPLRGPQEEAERRADELLAVFKELFGSGIGPRSSDLLMHALITVARDPNGTLVDVPALLTNAAFRRRLLPTVSDPLVLGPFWAGFEALGDAQRQTVIAPIQNKLRALTARAAIRRMLGQPDPTFSLDSLCSEQKVVLVNLNKGLIGPETTRLLGALLLQQLWRAIQRRAATPSKQRVPAMVVVDEWQDFVAALDFADVLSTSRGLGVGWTMAHQHLGQLSTDLQAAVLANARSRIAFRPSQKDAGPLAAVLGNSISAAELERLDAYQAVARVLSGNSPSDPFLIQTEPLLKASTPAARLRRTSAEIYGADGAAVDAAIQARWQQTDKPSGSGPVGARKRRTDA